MSWVTLLERFRRGDRLALSRLLSLLARGERSDEILGRLDPTPRGTRGSGSPARVVALTGGVGVGKSSLTGKLIEAVRPAGTGGPPGLSVAVLACDPQSPLSGGALLGDRFRMPSQPDDGVFIRSLATPGGQGALAEHLDHMIRLLEAFGFDLILVETVGAGQGDTSVRDLVDVVVLLLQPETGDDLQWEKAGVLEVADLIVVHKADLPGAANVEAQVRSMLALGGRDAPPVFRVSARTGAGIAELLDTLLAQPLRRKECDRADDLLRLARDTLTTRFSRARTAQDAELQGLLGRWQRGELSAAQAASELLRLLAQQQGSGVRDQGSAGGPSSLTPDS
ncbi:MAG: methylmalonyl Co-A mutase-associated GTPase MeaB [Planctomycetes bacterium]|nr:methylmalonyl Co-A mutase-associated GTPase MeaB [Planctomycetota bacterium]